jgi:Zn-dependent protease with chaperone function
MLPVMIMFGSFGAAFLFAWGLNWLALIPWRRSADNHWTERARLLYPARKSARLNPFFIATNIALVTFVLATEFNFLFAAGPAFLGALLAGYPMSRELHPEIQFHSWLHLVASSVLLLFGFWAVLFFGVIAMPENFGPLTWAIAGVVLLVLIAFLFGLGVRLMRWLRLLKPAPEHLMALVEEISQKMKVPVRATWVLSTHLSNAVALPLTRQLIFTEKLLSTHPDAEIKAICAHELGHLNEPRKVIFVRALVALALFPLVFINPMNSLTGVDNGFLLLLIPVLILFLVGMRVSRRMEKRADKIAIESEYINPEVYARALERIYQTNQMPAVMPRRSNKIHPDLYDRMLAAGVTPDFPKPAPAKGLSWSSCLVLAGLFVLPGLAGFIKAFWGVWQIGVNP